MNQYDKWRLLRYHRQAYHETTFDNQLNELLHKIGTLRVVYDVKRIEWRLAQVDLNPITWIVIATMYLYVFLWHGLSSVRKEWSKLGVFPLPDVNEKLDDGRNRFLNRNGMLDQPPTSKKTNA